MLKAYIITFIILCTLAVGFLKYQCESHTNKKGQQFYCTAGKYKGITQDFKTWRKIAQEEAQRQKNARLQVLARLGTDEEVNGVLYILGIELKELK